MNAVGAINIEPRDSWDQKERVCSGLESLGVSRWVFKRSMFPACAFREMLLSI